MTILVKTGVLRNVVDANSYSVKGLSRLQGDLYVPVQSSNVFCSIS